MKQKLNEPPLGGSDRQKSRKKKQGIDWHTAFVQALQMELIDYKDMLEFHCEFPLYSEPLRIDCIVVKKSKNVVIKKKIAEGFRAWNVVEYKSPSDYISISDFYKVYAYAGLCVSRKDTTISELTITFVGSRKPQKLLNYLREEQGYTIAETSKGVYSIYGDKLPIQIVDRRYLPVEENLWLNSLSDKLDIEEVDRISEAIAEHGDPMSVGIYVEAIIQANKKKIQEARKMGSTAVERIAKDIGLVEKWESIGEARGRDEGEAKGRIIGFAEGKLEIARKMKIAGKPLVEIEEFTGFSPGEIAKL